MATTETTVHAAMVQHLKPLVVSPSSLQMAPPVTRWRSLARGAGAASLGFAMALQVACGGGEDAQPSAAVVATESPAPLADATRATTHRKRPVSVYSRLGVTALTVSSDGDSLGLAGSDGRIVVLGTGNVSTSQAQAQSMSVRRAVAVAGLAFSGDGRHLVSIGRDSVAELWRVSTGDRRLAMNGHEHPLRAVATSANGAWIATGGDGTRVMVWGAESGRLTQSLGGQHADSVNALSFHPDSRLLASGDASGRVIVWDVETGRVRWNLQGHNGEVTAVAFSNDGSRLVTADNLGQALVWDATTGIAMGGLTGSRSAIRSLAFSTDTVPSDVVLAMGSADGRVSLWDVERRQMTRSFDPAAGGINVLVFDRKNAKRLFVGGEQNELKILNLISGLSLTGATLR